MNFCPGTSWPSVCFLLVPTNHCSVNTSETATTLTEVVPTDNAEKNSQIETQPGHIRVTRQDLLMEGYEQTKKTWTEQQDAKLLQLCADENARFEQIALMMPGRNPKMCYSRYRRLSNQSKDCWSQAQNDKLSSLVEDQQQINWKSVALHFPNRNYKQLKDHYENYLRPNLSNQQWTIEEDMQLIRLLNVTGQNWKTIQQSMPHRSRNQIKNRYFGRIKRIEARKRTYTVKQHQSH